MRSFAQEPNRETGRIIATQTARTLSNTPTRPFTTREHPAPDASRSTPLLHDFSTIPISPGPGPQETHGLARRGTAGVGGPLPYLEKIGRSFGSGHRLDGVRAHTGREATTSARSIGAEAYATGMNIAFGGTPSLRVAAHEAAHIIQQQHGVSLANGMGRSGDAYERNANEVADRVVRGESASDLLPSPAPRFGGFGSPSTNAPVQTYTEVSGLPYDRLSDDGKMAVLDHKRKAWAESSNITNSNTVLDGIKSKVKLKEVSGGDITTSPPGNSKTTLKLKQFQVIDRATGSEASLVDDCGGANQQIMGSEKAGYESFTAVTKRGTTEEYTGPSAYIADDNSAGGIVSTTEKMSGEIYIRIFDREFGKKLSRVDALKEWNNLGTKEQERLSEKYGINKFAAPKVGQGVTIGSERDMPGASETGYNFHFGFNLMASGHDYITLEDYDSSGVLYYFDMYGPASKKQSWAEAKSNVDAVDDKFTTMVVQHPETLNGIVNKDGIFFEDDPAAPTGKKTLAKDTKVTIMRKGQSWMKVLVGSGPLKNEAGWILNQFYTDN